MSKILSFISGARLRAHQRDTQNIVSSRSMQRTLLIAFSSLNYEGDKLCSFDFEGLKGSSTFDCILLRDLTNRWFTYGVDQYDSVGKLSRHLHDTCRAYDQAICIGSSMGGFAAILYGTLIGASRIISFAPQTIMTPEILAARDPRWITYKLHPDYRDLAALARRTGAAPPALLLCAASEPEDAFHADHIAGRRPSVTVMKLPEADHHVANEFRKTGYLRPLVEAAVSGATPLGDVVGAFNARY